MRDAMIQIRGAKDHPLQGVDLDLPVGELICLQGADGSGARELALGVLYRESRRRYAQVLSAFERETLGGGLPAAAEQVSGLPPALYLNGVLRQRQHLAGLLQLEGPLGRLWQEQGQAHCPACGGRCRATTPEEAADQVIADLGGEPCLVLAPLELGAAMVEELRRAGFLRVRVAGQVLRLDRDVVAEGPGEVVLDRVDADLAHRGRLVEACRQGRTISRGLSLFVGTHSKRALWLNQQLSCVACGRRYAAAGLPELGTAAGTPANLSLAGWDWRDLATKQLGQVRDLLETQAGAEGLRGPLAEANALGLGHLQLGRPLDQLSTGEEQELQVAWCLGLGLTGILYLFESPTRGLDTAGQRAVIAGLLRLVAQGNTVVALDHNEALAGAARVIYTFEAGRPSSAAPTAAAPPSQPKPRAVARWLRVQDPAGEWRLPLGRVVGVVGPTGAGKSTLCREVLLTGLQTRRGGSVAVEGRPGIQRALVLDQLPGDPDRMLLDHLGITPGIAAQYAESSAARDQGYTREWFMLGRPGGRCPTCEGTGALRCDLEFGDDVALVCPACEGRRYRPEALVSTWRGLNLAQVLDLTIAAAAHHFRGVPQVGEVLQAALGCGLGHRRLGEPARCLGPAESIRLLLAGELRRAGPREFLVLDHPEAGGHPRDLRQLVEILGELTGRGTSVLVETHHPFLIRAADWLVEVRTGQSLRSESALSA